MRYDTAQAPLGSPARAKAQLANLDLLKALKTCRNGNIPLENLKTDLDTCLQRLCDRRAYGVILSGYYVAGVFGPYTINDLLRRMYDARDYPSFLKQAYRFDVYRAFEAEVEKAIAWHFERGLPDAEAWRRKFAKLREQDSLREPAEPPTSVQIEEELPDDSKAAPRLFPLKPIISKTPRAHAPEPEPADDPYVISQTARLKFERANAAHERTLRILKNFLRQESLPVSESKLIDAYTVLSGRPAIFEIKSLTETNERDQIRHALSQLYEYRFLHAVKDATLWIVFSQAPSSRWYIDYLTGDRDVRVLWVEGGNLCGPSLTQLR